MRTEVREEVRQYTTYITEDGREFTNRHQAIRHEADLIKKNDPREIKSDWVMIDEETGANIYYCKTADDLHYLGATEWLHYDLIDGFIGPGWYMAIFRDGGDHYDYYDIYNCDKYFKKLKKIVEEYESVMKEWEGKV